MNTLSLGQTYNTIFLYKLHNFLKALYDSHFSNTIGLATLLCSKPNDNFVSHQKKEFLFPQHT